MKPILFNTEMVRAILDGSKTVTRRVVKPQYGGALEVHDDLGGIPCLSERCGSLCKGLKPPCQPGDILYVRETWQKNPYGIGWPYFYKASPEEFDHAPDKWSPSIHMPRKAARIFLRVTDVRVERLQAMGHEDAEQEGCWCDEGCLAMPIDRFADVWNSTLKPKDRALYGWDANPWVWVIEFER